ncbi:hypothetical protein [Rhodoplanes sp. SY1]|uniref:hypothetical protein n=1 Tax=Rhodoplanes sp. SY1 TaxID=3166646 RepID=UPI0038B5069C
MTDVDGIDPSVLRGVALVLAAVTRHGHAELARRIAAELRVDPGALAEIDPADLEALRDAIGASARR